MGYIPESKLNNPHNVDKVHNLVEKLEGPDILTEDEMKEKEQLFETTKDRLIEMGEPWIAENLSDLIRI